MKISCLFKRTTLPFFLILVFISCNKTENNDPCDDTVKPEKSVSIKATVHVLDKDHVPIANQEVNLSIYKWPCGADAKGFFYFNGPTNELGLRQTTLCNYSLRNSEDQVWVDAHAVNLGNGFCYSGFGICDL